MFGNGRSRVGHFDKDWDGQKNRDGTTIAKRLPKVKVIQETTTIHTPQTRNVNLLGYRRVCCQIHIVQPATNIIARWTLRSAQAPSKFISIVIAF